jgi:ActR/RegA family two-component response regulator
MLIIEDDLPFVDLMRATLGLQDVRVARTMAEAIAMIDQSAPHVILLDLTLPDSPLTQTLERIHELKTRSKDATLIVITGHHDVAQLKDSAVKAGAKTVLSKDKGFFNSLSEALISSGWSRPPCVSESVVDKIEATVHRIVAPK